LHESGQLTSLYCTRGPECIPVDGEVNESAVNFSSAYRLL